MKPSATALTPEDERLHAAWDAFVAALRKARARASHDPAAHLTLSQYHLLSALHDEPEMGVGELALAAGVTSPTATRMLDGLERGGIVERVPSPRDRRCVAVHLTDTGKRALRAEHRRIAAKQRALFEQLEPEERAQAERLMLRLSEIIEDLS
jgi:DNA-binding MarR family transcriptional regulator